MGNGIRQQDRERLQAVRVYLEEHLGEPLSQARLCRVAGMNKIKLNTGFRHVYGQTPFVCLYRLRMERARALLITTDYPIKAIAAMTGYTNVKSFHRAFRAYHHCTPMTLCRGFS